MVIPQEVKDDCLRLYTLWSKDMEKVTTMIVQIHGERYTRSRASFKKYLISKEVYIKPKMGGRREGTGNRRDAKFRKCGIKSRRLSDSLALAVDPNVI